VEADQLATEYKQEDQMRWQMVELFPSTKAQLIIAESSVTREIPQAGRVQIW
jgi:hypothetical protein